jgi:hypothetical protein
MLSDVHVIISEVVMFTLTHRTLYFTGDIELLGEVTYVSYTPVMFNGVPSMVECRGSGGEYGFAPWALVRDDELVQVYLMQTVISAPGYMLMQRFHTAKELITWFPIQPLQGTFNPVILRGFAPTFIIELFNFSKGVGQFEKFISSNLIHVKLNKISPDFFIFNQGSHGVTNLRTSPVHTIILLQTHEVIVKLLHKGI